MDAVSLSRLPSELLYLWHTHRADLLLSAGILFAIVRLAVHWRGRKSKEALTPPLLLTPTDEKELAVPSVKEQLVETDHYEAPALKPATRPKAGPKRVTGTKKPKSNGITNEEGAVEKIQPLIFYYTLGGSTKAYAETLAARLQASSSTNNDILPPELLDLAETEYDDYFLSHPKETGTAHFYLLLLPTYNIDTNLSAFLAHLDETHHDFRIDTAPLSSLAGYSVFGLGDRQEWPTEAEGFCLQAVEADRWMAKLTGGRRGFPMGTGDVQGGDVRERLAEWTEGVRGVMGDLAEGRGLGEGVRGSGDAVESGDEADSGDEEELGETSSKPVRRKTGRKGLTDDLEDIKAPIPVDFTTPNPRPTKTKTPAPPKPMVPVASPTYTSLTKQGYSIIGTHSGVKTCRWTKSALRGRGSCYKYSFYGIASHRCMEATPSLSCSNKCVFCWRHGTNPVGTTWRWQVDPPALVFAGIKAAHYQKIKMLRGVPGVRSERFHEAMTIRHCALSLVGEPIFYPHINELLGMLHKEHISTFLVCNAQHPDQLAALGPVAQLYVSIDASNKESLRRIDRPLHRDYWERFLRCMDILHQKRFTHRTVFRLTLVKGFNVEEEAEGYAGLVERARPGFVEVKGVTFCGTSTAAGAGLTMGNVPYWEEVLSFVKALEGALEKRGLSYGVGAEHAHSCCILLADRERFFREPVAGSGFSRVGDEGPLDEARSDAVAIGGANAGSGGEVSSKRWHTLIDYAQFFRCLESGEPFGPEDYIGGPTPEWALEGRGGFDPRDERVDRKGRPKVV